MYDAIIVGARCAGASTAMLLARHGHRVLLVDRASFPSDLTSSTHLVWQSGAAHLQRWGLLSSVAASGCPELSTMTADLGEGIVLRGSPAPVDGVADAYAPRRVVLDQILVDAAVAAGAELREGCTVEELTFDEGRATGVVGRARSGGRFAESARVVIGADGMNSRVARLVQAPERNHKPLLMGTWFSYWRDVPVDGIVFYLRDYRLVYTWPTNDGLTLVGVDWAARDFPTGQPTAEAEFFSELTTIAPALAEQVKGGRREERWIGGPPIPGIVRRPYGPGWALVGDAGYLRDFGTAQGISDAFRDAELLATALHDTWTSAADAAVAMAAYETRRDQAAMPMYEFTEQFAALQPPPPEMRSLFAALANNADQTNRFFGVFAGSVPVGDFFGPDNLAEVMAKGSPTSPSISRS
jgi:2-polyprenyl-6-methoxyphenol hydroxylase-like FAD-dependent oxidoreductase